MGNEAIGGFVIGSEIGKGSFAQVYLGKHKTSGMTVAIKSVELQRLNKKLKDNLRSEIQILEKLRHPHIVALHQCLESSTHIHLIMEYCELGDLSLFIKKRDKLITNPATQDMARKYPMSHGGGLNEVASRHFLKQLVSALEFLRTKNLVHRDVKPQNLLLLAPPKFRDASKNIKVLAASADSLTPIVGLASMPMLKLADFGFARVLPSTTLAETLCGSPLYMAPEILRYEKYDAKADLWSVGTVLYEMVSGRPPFRANNHVELLRKIEAADDVIKFPRDVHVSNEMKALIRALLKRSPTERMSFEDFFANHVVTGPIPGLIEDDLPNPPMPEQALPTQYPIGPSRQGDTGSRRFSLTNRYQSPSSIGMAYTPGAQHSPVNTAPSEPRGLQGLGIRPPLLNTQSPVRPLGPQSSISKGRIQPGLTTEERASQDAMLDREYVLVDKNQVEVNAIADQLAAVGKVGRSPKSIEVVKRASTVGKISVQTVQGQRTTPFDKNMAGSPTSFITKAIHDASLRLFGFKNPQPFLGRTGTSLLQGYSAFPAYPSTPAPAGLLGEGKSGAPVDEDNRVAQRIEDFATLSDVVYGFAEVKYRQLVPLAPSMDHGLGGIPADQVASDDDGLTVDAIVTLSEEALVLYCKSLALLAKAMNIAGMWWARKTRVDSSSFLQSMPGGADMTPRINSAVQWTRSRFNEVLEKAELAKQKLQEAQKQLPLSHQNHPSNHSPDPTSASGSGTDGVFLTPGISAEKLMYERAVEMSRSAAINEVTNADLDGCELSYITALRMLEAVLDTDENFASRQLYSNQREGELNQRQQDTPSEISPNDQQSVYKVMKMVTARLTAVRYKKSAIANAEKAEQLDMASRRQSGDITPRSVRSHTS